jgi:hypothetical protein
MILFIITDFFDVSSPKVLLFDVFTAFGKGAGPQGPQVATQKRALVFSQVSAPPRSARYDTYDNMIHSQENKWTFIYYY